MLKGSIFLFWALGALVGSALAYEESVVQLDYGFDPDKIISPWGIELHSNAAFGDMEPYAYAFTINENASVTRYVPEGNDVDSGDYSEFKVSYHAGKGVIFGNATEENLNLKVIGIGFLYGINSGPSEEQLVAAADLITELKRIYPKLSIVAGQNAMSGYRLNNTTVCNVSSNQCYIVEGGLLSNPWNFPMEYFTWILNSAGNQYGIEWNYRQNINHLGPEVWDTEYIEST